MRGVVKLRVGPTGADAQLAAVVELEGELFTIFRHRRITVRTTPCLLRKFLLVTYLTNNIETV